VAHSPTQGGSAQARAGGQSPQAGGIMVAYRANDRGRGLVTIADCRRLAQGGYSYRNTDHLQPRACRRQRTSCETYAA